MIDRVGISDDIFISNGLVGRGTPHRSCFDGVLWGEYRTIFGDTDF